LEELHEKKGSSKGAILKYVTTNFDVDQNTNKGIITL
jgi:hypothetical protein